jgi:amidase
MPGGSSVGPAVAAAAGFAPLTIGCETSGSIVTPAIRAALYALKPSVGLVNLDGIIGLSTFFDSPGPMGKSAADIELGYQAMVDDSDRPDLKKALAEINITLGWKGMRLGFGDPKEWSMWESHCPQKEGTAEQMVCHLASFLKDPVIKTDM